MRNIPLMQRQTRMGRCYTVMHRCYCVTVLVSLSTLVRSGVILQASYTLFVTIHHNVKNIFLRKKIEFCEKHVYTLFVINSSFRKLFCYSKKSTLCSSWRRSTPVNASHDILRKRSQIRTNHSLDTICILHEFCCFISVSSLFANSMYRM